MKKVLRTARMCVFLGGLLLIPLSVISAGLLGSLTKVLNPILKPIVAVVQPVLTPLVSPTLEPVVTQILEPILTPPTEPVEAPSLSANSRDMKLLVLTADGTEPSFASIKAILNQIGVPYDAVVLTQTGGQLPALSGTQKGNYQGIILATGNLVTCSTTPCTIALPEQGWDQLDKLHFPRPSLRNHVDRRRPSRRDVVIPSSFEPGLPGSYSHRSDPGRVRLRI